MRINDSPVKLNVQTQQLLKRLEHEAAVLVRVHASRGSVPREVGAWMAVFAHDCLGTAGGGQVEWTANGHARHLLARGGAAEQTVHYSLGPSLGQ
ncbi:MAG: xanthine dehydrogenase accessory protein XdhC, partial [Rhodoferax sp.]|nr:xanthine dehydrogenase accessory protein XdhC [Rhodoferax sp.]